MALDGGAAILRVRKGAAHVLFAFDVGHSIDLEVSKRRIHSASDRPRFRHKRHAPNYFQFDPPPLRVARETPSIEVGGARTTPLAEAVLYDFGAVSIGYEIPLEGDLERLVDLSCVLGESDLLALDARAQVEDILRTIEPGVAKPRLSDLSEDYVVFEVRDWEGEGPASSLPDRHRETVARALRAEKGPLSEQECADATSARVSFGPDDVALVDWNGAILFDRDAADVRTVLEFANVQLLEMRHLDGRLDAALDRAYEMRGATIRFRGRTGRASLEEVAEMQIDGAILFEQVGNALKLLGDQYLARVYGVASKRFRLGEWNAGILRKLETLESLYRKMTDRSSATRMELLEAVIIVLILVSIVLPFVLGDVAH
jgi:hypothetical protein